MCYDRLVFIEWYIDQLFIVYCRYTETVISEPAGLTIGYQKDTWIERENGGYLTLPQATYGGMCTDTIPLRYTHTFMFYCI